MDLERPARENRRLVLNAQKLDYGDAEGVRLLLTVADVTEARAAETLKTNLPREKEVPGHCLNVTGRLTPSSKVSG
jgi:hypothetical protein